MGLISRCKQSFGSGKKYVHVLTHAWNFFQKKGEKVDLNWWCQMWNVEKNTSSKFQVFSISRSREFLQEKLEKINDWKSNWKKNTTQPTNMPNFSRNRTIGGVWQVFLITRMVKLPIKKVWAKWHFLAIFTPSPTLKSVFFIKVLKLRFC